MTVELIQGDCLDIMRGMDDKSVDFIWTDPPYNVNKNYGTYTDNLSDEDYINFCGRWISEAKRISDNRMAVYTPTKYLLEYWNLLGKDYKQIILTWSPEGAFRYGFVNQHASILTNVKPKIRTKDVWHNVQVLGLGYFFREESFGHPGYTSEQITKKVLTSFTAPGEIVCDVFSGTGTTAVCCVYLDRNFIGSEIDPKWYELANSRVKVAQMQPGLFA